MPKLSKEAYKKKYVGKSIKGRKVPKDKKKLKKKYDGLYAIMNKGDVTGYVIGNKVHAKKGKSDRSQKSSQSHEKSKVLPLI